MIYYGFRINVNRLRISCQKWVLIMYFFITHPEASIQAGFTPNIFGWALEGLSHLATFTEDQCGIVQFTLPVIILMLQGVADEYSKLLHDF